MRSLQNLGLQLFETIIGVPATLDYYQPAFMYDYANVLDYARREKILIVRAGQKLGYKRNFWVYLPEISSNWLEICVKDEAEDGTFSVEKLRYSEAHLIDEFIRVNARELYGGLNDQEFYASLGDANNLELLIQKAREENCKKGRR